MRRACARPAHARVRTSQPARVRTRRLQTCPHWCATRDLSSKLLTARAIAGKRWRGWTCRLSATRLAAFVAAGPSAGTELTFAPHCGTVQSDEWFSPLPVQDGPTAVSTVRYSGPPLEAAGSTREDEAEEEEEEEEDEAAPPPPPGLSTGGVDNPWGTHTLMSSCAAVQSSGEESASRNRAALGQLVTPLGSTCGDQLGVLSP